jgi:hypothetical protein
LVFKILSLPNQFSVDVLVFPWFFICFTFLFYSCLKSGSKKNCPRLNFDQQLLVVHLMWTLTDQNFLTNSENITFFQKIFNRFCYFAPKLVLPPGTICKYLSGMSIVYVHTSLAFVS